MRTKADRDDDLAIGRALERKDHQIELLRAALKPFALMPGAVSLSKALGHITREDLIRASDAFQQEPIGPKETTCEATKAQMAEQVTKAIAQIEAGDFEEVNLQEMRPAREVIGEWGEIYRWDGGDCRAEALEEADALIKVLDEAGYAIVPKPDHQQNRDAP